MNILYIDHYAGSPDMGMEFRPYYLSREWTKMGHKVSIIAGDYSHLRKKNPRVFRDMEKQSIDGIDYYWMKTGTYKGNGVSRAFTMLRFCIKLYNWKKWINDHLNPDVVISSSTYPIDSIPAHLIATAGCISSKHIHEVHDMWPATLIEIGGMSKLNPFVMAMQYGENYAYSHADAVVSLPKYSKDYMKQHGLKGERFHYIPNGIVIDEWDNPEPLPEEHKRALQQLSDKGEFIIGYFGGHALSNCLMPLVQTAEQMQDERVHFVLVGDGVEKNELIHYAEERKLNNITFLPPVSKRTIPTLTDYFDSTYIGAKDSSLYRFGACMNKMFDGMMAGKPIIFAINAPPTPVTDANCGLVIPPENKEELKKAIQTLIKMKDVERSEMGKRGRNEILHNYTYKKLAEEFVSVMEG